MASHPDCTKCKGSGLVDREGAERDAAIHPILSQSQQTCDVCGGSGRMPPASVRRVAVETQAASDS
jgi:DnaJ-class molecular chaperone